MTAPDTITSLVPSTGTSVAKFGDAAEVRMRLQIMRASVPGLSKRKRQNVNGRWVDTDEYTVSDELVVALVVAEARTGLSAARGEIGVIPGSGLYVATKVKVADAIRAAAERRDPFVPEFRRVVATELDPLWALAQSEYGAEEGDVVAAVTLRRHVITQAWYAERNAKADELARYGIKGQQALDIVNAEFGDRAPVCVALGVVKGSENFGGADDEEGSTRWRPRDSAEAAKWDVKQAAKKARSEAIYSRYDRACKRAFTRALSQYGLAAPDQRDFGAAADYITEGDEATPTSVIASATLTDAEADMRRAQLEAEAIAISLAPPAPPDAPSPPQSAAAESARRRITNRDEELDRQPSLVIEGTTRVVPDKPQGAPPLDDKRRAAINHAADWLSANPRINSDNLPALKAHIATLRWEKPSDKAVETANDLRALFAVWIGDQIGGEVAI